MVGSDSDCDAIQIIDRASTATLIKQIWHEHPHLQPINQRLCLRSRDGSNNLRTTAVKGDVRISTIPKELAEEAEEITWKEGLRRAWVKGRASCESILSNSGIPDLAPDWTNDDDIISDLFPSTTETPPSPTPSVPMPSYPASSAPPVLALQLPGTSLRSTIPVTSSISMPPPPLSPWAIPPSTAPVPLTAKLSTAPAVTVPVLPSTHTFDEDQEIIVDLADPLNQDIVDEMEMDETEDRIDYQWKRKRSDFFFKDDDGVEIHIATVVRYIMNAAWVALSVDREGKYKGKLKYGTGLNADLIARNETWKKDPNLLHHGNLIATLLNVGQEFALAICVFDSCKSFGAVGDFIPRSKLGNPAFSTPLQVPLLQLTPDSTSTVSATQSSATHETQWQWNHQYVPVADASSSSTTFHEAFDVSSQHVIPLTADKDFTIQSSMDLNGNDGKKKYKTDNPSSNIPSHCTLCVNAEGVSLWSYTMPFHLQQQHPNATYAEILNHNQDVSTVFLPPDSDEVSKVLNGRFQDI
ncbi:hypothetical protein BT69DRAFT_1355931 [Atractiella rhizophila]|nr:hypothetical protein BT69DRAFT_1355931 [Atractiella rhizophila]